MTPEESERRRTLAVVAVELAAEVARLAAASKSQADALEGLAGEVKHKAWKTTVKIRWMVALVVLDLILSGAMLIGYIKISDLVAEQDRTRAEVLCPLFGIFLGSYDPNSRTEGPAREAYEQAFTTIRHVHADVLHCTDPIVPGRSSSPKPTSLGPLGLLPEPPVPEPVAVVRPTANQSTPSQRPAVRRQVVHAPRTNTSKAKTKTSGGKTKSSGGSLLGSVTRAVPKVVPKVDVGGDVNLGPVKTKLRLHT